jgi:UDP-N-acetylmuramoyl-tripeptide--D-alanyl-D-alanine ligase
MFLTVVIAFIWYFLHIRKIYVFAHFHQLEGYYPKRFLLWLLHNLREIFPNTLLISMVVGGIVYALLADSHELAHIILIACIGLGAWHRRSAIITPYKSTNRAKRILGLSGVIWSIVWYVTVSMLLTSEHALLWIFVAGYVGIGLSTLSLVIATFILSHSVDRLEYRYYKRKAKASLADRPYLTKIGITGSYGKTSTKRFLDHILKYQFNVFSSPKSFNTPKGICLTINQYFEGDYRSEYFIAEMGAYWRGSIKENTSIVEPSIGIVVDVGPQHLERFGSMENIFLAKYELVEALPPDGTAVLNWDSDYVRKMYELGHPNKRITVSYDPTSPRVSDTVPQLVATDIQESIDGLSFTVTDRLTSETAVFQTRLLGKHNITNILLATAVAIEQGMTLQNIGKQVMTLEPIENRLSSYTNASGARVISDAYSANVKGVAEALGVLKLHAPNRRLVVTPGIVELGELMQSENQKLGVAIADAATDVALIGKDRTAPIYDGLVAKNFSQENIHIFESFKDAQNWYLQTFGQDAVILILNDLPDNY